MRAYQSLTTIRSGCLPKLVLKDAPLPDVALSLSLLEVGCESCQMLTVERRLLTRLLDADTPRNTVAEMSKTRAGHLLNMRQATAKTVSGSGESHLVDEQIDFDKI